MRERPLTQYHYDKLCQLIPGGVNSPVRACKNMHQLPMVVESAKDDLLFDVDGHSYIDFCGSWGALIHGHVHPQIIDAVSKRMTKGTSFGITTALEGELAQEVISLVKSIEKIRFVSSGTEATMSAVRVARGFTKRNMIIKFSGNYHGHADFFLIEAGSGVLDTCPQASSAGIPDEFIKFTLSLPYNDQVACQKIFSDPIYKDQIAAVILEPVAGNMGVIPADKEFLHFLRNKTREIGALLIFDEVMTGFRVAKGGAQEFYEIEPDLTCFGKIIGGGFPVAAFGGRADIMNVLAPLGPVYQAGTLSGNPVAIEAGLQSLRLLQAPQFYEEMQAKVDSFLNPIKHYIQEKNLPMCVQQAGAMFTLFFGRKEVRHLTDAQSCDQQLFASFFRTLFDQGIYIPPSQYEAWFMSNAHTPAHLNQTKEAVLNFLHQTYLSS